MKPAGRARLRPGRFEMRVAYRHAVPHGTRRIERGGLAKISRRDASCRDRLREDDLALFFAPFSFAFISPFASFASFSPLAERTAPAKGRLQGDSGIPFTFLLPASRSTVLFEYDVRGNDVRGVSKSSRRRRGIFIDAIWIRADIRDVQRRTCVARARARAPARYITRAFPLTALGASVGAFLIGNFRRQRGGILMARILIRLEFIRSLLVVRRSRVSAIKFRAINCLGAPIGSKVSFWAVSGPVYR